MYSLPAHEVSVFNTCVNQIPAPCHVSGSEKSEQNKILMRQKFSYPRIDPEASGIVDTPTDDQKMASILRICSQILSKDELQCWNELTEQFLENATRYESGIPKIRADMLQEIKHYRISEKAKKEMEDQLKNLPFSDFTNFKPFQTESEKQPLNEKIDQTDQMLIVNDLIEDQSLEVPTFYLQSNSNILNIQKVQNEIIQLWLKNFKLWEIFKAKRSVFLL